MQFNEDFMKISLVQRKIYKMFRKFYEDFVEIFIRTAKKLQTIFFNSFDNQLKRPIFYYT